MPILCSRKLRNSLHHRVVYTPAFFPCAGGLALSVSDSVFDKCSVYIVKYTSIHVAQTSSHGINECKETTWLEYFNCSVRYDREFSRIKSIFDYYTTRNYAIALRKIA